MTTRKELIQMMDDQNIEDGDVIVCSNMSGDFKDIVEVASLNGTPAIIFGFSDE